MEEILVRWKWWESILKKTIQSKNEIAVLGPLERNCWSEKQKNKKQSSIMSFFNLKIMSNICFYMQYKFTHCHNLRRLARLAR